MAMTMRTFLTRTYDDDKDDDNDGNERPRFFRQQPTLVGCIPGRGVVGDFYDDDKDENDNDGNYNEEDYCPCLFQKVLPIQSTAMPTVRTTTTTSFYDMTQQPTSWSDAFLADGGGGLWSRKWINALRGLRIYREEINPPQANKIT